MKHRRGDEESREMHLADAPCAMIATFPGMVSTAIITTMILAFVPPLRAQGYVDPGAGAMLWQILTASLVGAAFLFRKLVLSWFRVSKTPRPGGDTCQSPHSDK